MQRWRTRWSRPVEEGGACVSSEHGGRSGEWRHALYTPCAIASVSKRPKRLPSSVIVSEGAIELAMLVQPGGRPSASQRVWRNEHSMSRKHAPTTSAKMAVTLACDCVRLTGISGCVQLECASEPNTRAVPSAAARRRAPRASPCRRCAAARPWRAAGAAGTRRRRWP